MGSLYPSTEGSNTAVANKLRALDELIESSNSLTQELINISTALEQMLARLMGGDTSEEAISGNVLAPQGQLPQLIQQVKTQRALCDTILTNITGLEAVI